MGGGSDIAIDTAQLTIVGGRLSEIPKAVGLSRATLKVIRENLFWAFIYNVIGIPVAAGVLYPAFGLLLSPMIASAAMARCNLHIHPPLREAVPFKSSAFAFSFPISF